MCSTRTWEDRMKTLLRASMGVLTAAMLMMGCGGGAPVMPDYRGEPLVTLKGQLLLGEHVQVDEPVRLALVWYKDRADIGQPQEIVTEDIVYEPSFPVDFTFHLYAPPPPEALTEDSSGRFGFAILVAYRDDNHNGKLDPIPVGGVRQDKVLGATQSFFDEDGPCYRLSYTEDAGGQNGHFTLFHTPGGETFPIVRPVAAEAVPLDTPIALTLSGENELDALLCMASITVENSGSPNPLAFCGLTATPGILRVRASFVLRYKETPTGDSVQEQALVIVSDGTRWLTQSEATATLNGHPLPVGQGSISPGNFPTPGAVSTLIVSAPGFPTATYEIRAPGMPSLTSPARGATVPSGSPLRFTWTPGVFSGITWEDITAGAASTSLWNQTNFFNLSGTQLPTFDITTRPLTYTGDALARVVTYNMANYSRYGDSTFSEVEYTRPLTFTP